MQNGLVRGSMVAIVGCSLALVGASGCTYLNNRWSDAKQMMDLGLTFSIEQSRLAVLVHAIAAVVAIVVWIVHVYAAIWVKGTISAMTRGVVTGGWGWRHHRRWLREEIGKDSKSTPAE